MHRQLFVYNLYMCHVLMSNIESKNKTSGVGAVMHRTIAFNGTFSFQLDVAFATHGIFLDIGK